MTRAGPPPVDQAERDAAIHSSARRTLVVAGAGTGKTHLLVDRVCHLVSSGTPLDRIVAITFTEKAAGELRARIRDAVTARAARRERGMAEAREAVDRAPISTIHAFAAAILRRHPAEAGVDPAFDVLEEDAREVVVEETWDAWVARALAERADPWLDVVRAKKTPDRARLRDAARDLRAAGAAQTRPPIGRAPAEILAELRSLHASLAEIARGVTPTDALAKTIADFGVALRDAQPRASTILGLSFPKCGTKGRSEWWKGRIALARLRAEAMREALVAGQAALAHDLACGLAGWLRPFGASVDAALAAKGALDFDGILLAARDLLRSRPDVCARIAERHPCVCVDEYQDTDPVQTEILRMLEAAGSSLFLVGDPKQSIYGFRGADVEAFVDERTRAEAGGEVREIVQSFRASGRIVGALNAIFETVLPPPSERWEIPHAPLVARRAAGEGPAALAIVRPPQPLDASADECREAEAAAVVRLLGRMVRERWPVGDDGRPARFGDVAILLRKMTDAADSYARAFEEEGVPFLVVGGRRFFLQSEVRALVTALGAIDDPTRTVTVVGALRSPLFGVSDDAILASRGALDPLRPGTGPAARALETLGALHRSRADRPPHRLLERLVDETGLFGLLAIKPDGPRRIANVLKLVEAARAVGPPGTVSLRAFVRWCEDQGRRLEFGEPEAPVADETDPVLRILSIHAAKGLEFPIVVLGEPAGALAAQPPPVLVHGRALELKIADLATAGYDEAKARRAAREEAEERRLLYVALTRARDRLVLPLFGKRERSAARIVEALPAVTTAPAGDDVDVGRGVRAVVVVDEGREGVRARPPIRVADVLAAPRKPTPDPAAPPLAIRRRVRPSDEGEEEDELGRGLRAGSIDRARRIGRAVHAALERAPLGDADAVRAMAIAEAARLALSKGDAAEAADLAAAGAASEWTARAKRALRVWREVAFTWIDGDAVVEGQIDLLFEEKDGFVVVDYKTDRADTTHDAQLDLYARAVAAITGRRVTERVALVLRRGGEG